jgi:hypothetical protein
MHVPSYNEGSNACDIPIACLHYGWTLVMYYARKFTIVLADCQAVPADKSD